MLTPSYKNTPQTEAFINQEITDALTEQNTAAVVRAVLLWIARNYFNLDDGTININQVAGLVQALALKADLDSVGGKLLRSQLPRILVSEVFPSLTGPLTLEDLLTLKADLDPNTGLVLASQLPIPTFAALTDSPLNHPGLAAILYPLMLQGNRIKTQTYAAALNDSLNNDIELNVLYRITSRPNDAVNDIVLLGISNTGFAEDDAYTIQAGSNTALLIPVNYDFINDLATPRIVTTPGPAQPPYNVMSWANYDSLRSDEQLKPGTWTLLKGRPNDSVPYAEGSNVLVFTVRSNETNPLAVLLPNEYVVQGDVFRKPAELIRYNVVADTFVRFPEVMPEDLLVIQGTTYPSFTINSEGIQGQGAQYTGLVLGTAQGDRKVGLAYLWQDANSTPADLVMICKNLLNVAFLGDPLNIWEPMTSGSALAADIIDALNAADNPSTGNRFLTEENLAYVIGIIGIVAEPGGSICYVEGRPGSNIQGERGNPLRPFGSIREALNYSGNNDTIVVRPGGDAYDSFGRLAYSLGGIVRGQRTIDCQPGVIITGSFDLGGYREYQPYNIRWNGGLILGSLNFLRQANGASKGIIQNARVEGLGRLYCYSENGQYGSNWLDEYEIRNCVGRGGVGNPNIFAMGSNQNFDKQAQLVRLIDCDFENASGPVLGLQIIPDTAPGPSRVILRGGTRIARTDGGAPLVQMRVTNFRQLALESDAVIDERPTATGGTAPVAPATTPLTADTFLWLDAGNPLGFAKNRVSGQPDFAPAAPFVLLTNALNNLPAAVIDRASRNNSGRVLALPGPGTFTLVLKHTGNTTLNATANNVFIYYDYDEEFRLNCSTLMKNSGDGPALAVGSQFAVITLHFPYGGRTAAYVNGSYVGSGASGNRDYLGAPVYGGSIDLFTNLQAQVCELIISRDASRAAGRAHESYLKTKYAL